MNVHNQKNPYSSPWTTKQRVKMLLWEFAWKFCCSWTPKPANRWRLFWLKLFGAKIYGAPFVHQRARIQIPWNLTLHDHATLGDRTNAYSLGNIEMKQGKNAEAMVHYEVYAKSNKISVDKKTKVEKTIKDARFIENAMKNPVPFNPKSLGDKVNTPQYSEYLPSLTADGQTIVYTARVNKQEDFYMAKKVNDEWQKGEPMTELNTEENEGAECISADGNLLLYTVCNRPGLLGSCDIFFSQKKDGKWTTPRGFTPISSPSWDSQPSISADGKTIYFASDRPGGCSTGSAARERHN